MNVMLHIAPFFSIFKFRWVKRLADESVCSVNLKDRQIDLFVVKTCYWSSVSTPHEGERGDDLSAPWPAKREGKPLCELFQVFTVVSDVGVLPSFIENLKSRHPEIMCK